MFRAQLTDQRSRSRRDTRTAQENQTKSRLQDDGREASTRLTRQGPRDAAALDAAGHTRDLRSPLPMRLQRSALHSDGLERSDRVRSPTVHPCGCVQIDRRLPDSPSDPPRCPLGPLLLSASAPMGNSYNLHKACPDHNARFLRCQKLYFENKFVAMPPLDANGAQPPRVVVEDTVPVKNPADIALTLDALDPTSMNFACRDLWEDYKECVEGVMREKQQDYLRRKEAKKAANAAQTNTTPAATEQAKQ